MKRKSKFLIVSFLLLLILIWVLFNSSTPEYDVRYTITDLGTLGGETSHAWAVSDSGLVVGDSPDASKNIQAFVWSAANGMESLAEEDWHSSYGTMVSDSGWIVIRARTLQKEDQTYIREPDGDLMLVEDPEGGVVFLFDINDAGAAVGIVRPATEQTDRFIYPAIIRTASGGIVHLGFSSKSGNKLSINRKGEVAATRWVPESEWTPYRGVNRACLWSATEGVTDLGTIGGKESWAKGLNDRGEVVGWADGKDGVRHPFIWKDGEIEQIGTPNGKGGGAIAINDQGEIVGKYTLGGIEKPKWFRQTQRKVLRWAFVNVGLDYFPGEQRGFYWKDGVSVKFDHLRKDNSLPMILIPSHINDQGQIVGRNFFVRYQGGGMHAFLLTPIKEDNDDGD